jgi:hypothetical protein
MAVNRSVLAQALGRSARPSNYLSADQNQRQLLAAQDISQFAMNSSNFGSGQARDVGLAAQLATAGIGAYTQYKAQKDINEQELSSQAKFSQQFPHLADIASTLSPETRQAYTLEVIKSSLKSAEPLSSIGKISADYKSGLIDEPTYRGAVKKESSFAPDASASGGATGALIRQYQKETGSDYKTAFGAVKGLTSQGVTYDPQGNIVPISGYAEAKGGIETQKTAGKAKGEAVAGLISQESKLPELETAVQELSNLGKTATYTKTGQYRDTALRELGLPVTSGAVARKEYISKVDNQILPLLRDTFGAQFTEREGETLRKTLGDPNSSPKEKDAVLKSFIEQKRATIESTKRQVGAQNQPQASGGFKIISVRDK